MGIGKMLGLAVLGVGAVAAAPFTGGGSLLGAASLGASLAGAGTVAGAVGAGAVGAAIGNSLSNNEKKEQEKIEKKLSEANLKADEFENIASAHKSHTNYVLALSALAISIANADGEISEEEIEEFSEFIGGLASSEYPDNITDEIEGMLEDPPTFKEAMKHLKNVEVDKYNDIRNLLVSIAEADEIMCPNEIAYIEAFDRYIS